MKKEIRILHLEDSPRDAALIRSKLVAGGLACEFTVVDGEPEFAAALAGKSWDLILCDNNISDYDGLSALKLAKEKQPATPLIMVSGSLGEEEAVQRLQLGATDYILKQRLERLVPAVQRALHEAEELRNRQRAEAALRESEERFRNLAENSDEGFWFMGLNPRRINYVSPGVEKIWALPATRFYEDSDRWAKAIHPDDQPRVHAAFEASLRPGAPARFKEEYRVVQPNGAVRWVLDSGTPIRDAAGAVVSSGGVVRDITERKEAEELMLRAQRIENIGMLAAGIAHDFNNALAPIIMAGPLVRQHVSHPSGLSLLAMMEKSAERSAGLVQQLLTFARGSSGQNQLLQARHVLREVTELAGATFPKSIRVESHLPGDLWLVQANPTQLHQILLNLCVNARDAMPQGGELTLTAANRALDAAAAAGIAGAQAGNFLTIEVRDSGTGIPPDVLARIWEPFYTTKGEGKGTGLGLSTVHGIVENHRGFVTVQTRTGQGTAFTVYLPAAPGETGDGEPGARDAQPQRGDGELVLVVDDEEPVREISASILTGHGYRVVTAGDGAEAIAVFAPRAAEVRLLLTDSDMPILGGAALAAALRRLKPDLPVIAMSGAASRSSLTQKEFTTVYLAKPFQAESLLSLVRRTLDEARPPASSPIASVSPTAT
jgi:PAS domain S-box-containing protein